MFCKREITTTISSIYKSYFLKKQGRFFYIILPYPFYLSPLFLSFLVWPLLPTPCRCTGLLLHLITPNDTHTHTFGRTPLDEGSARRRTSTWQRTTFTRHKLPCHWRDSNPQSQQKRGRRPTPQTTGIGYLIYHIIKRLTNPFFSVVLNVLTPPIEVPPLQK